MSKFFDEMNASPWKGIISEVGVGLGFTPDFVNHPGASKTILEVRSPYDGFYKCKSVVRAVSLENAQATAYDNFRHATERMCQHDGSQYFGLSITGAHYEDRASHAWISFITSGMRAYMHVYFNESDRYHAAIRLSEIVQWFLRGVCLKDESWQELITEKDNIYYDMHVDVLYAPGVSDVERLLLLNGDNPLVYDNGKFQRTVDYLRSSDRIYAGSFNPPHNGHCKAAGDNVLLELSKRSCYKNDVSIEDLIHRIRMINLLGFPVMITDLPLFVSKHKVFSELHSKEYVYRIGADAWNAFVAHHQYPNNTWLSERLKNARFEIVNRPNSDITENLITKNLSYEIMNMSLMKESSTAVRSGNRDYIDERVADYIESHNLYSQ